MEIYGQVHAPAALPPGKSLLKRILCGSQSQSRHAGKNVALPGIDPQFPRLAAHLHLLDRILTDTSVLTVKGLRSVSVDHVWQTVIIKKIFRCGEAKKPASILLTDGRLSM